jgi:transcriptional regulator with XRE-family HTH domain
MVPPVEAVRIGLAFRALRRARHWTQAQLATRAGVSRSLVARVERGGSDRCSLRTLEALASALGARTSYRLLWHGEELDRLLDAAHAALVDEMLRRLAASSWEARAEVTFAIRGERGSIDILARRPPTGDLLVIEVKSVVPDVQALLAGLDRKTRLAPLVARDLGWRVSRVSRLLVLPDDRTARRRIGRLVVTFDQTLPARTLEIRQWFIRPDRTIAGILFLAGATQVNTRHRIATARPVPERGRRGGS